MSKLGKELIESAKEALQIAQRQNQLEQAVTLETVERTFWEENDSADHVDWSKAKRVRLPNLKPS
jgi:CopG antitoxin of type II toxin-antitoxin system